MRKLLFLSAFIFVGCATTNSGIVETGPDSYMISKQSGNFGTLKTDSIKEANIFCKEQGKHLQVTNTQDNMTGIGWAEKAHSDVQFMCLSEGDPRLKGGPLVPISSAPADKIINGK